uniref:Uncharacterized protein n=1 Tax=Anguilla anguilla TaxID=7936 RepID=A0A0E9Q8V8_ANGAN
MFLKKALACFFIHPNWNHCHQKQLTNNKKELYAPEMHLSGLGPAKSFRELKTW